MKNGKTRLLVVQLFLLALSTACTKNIDSSEPAEQKMASTQGRMAEKLDRPTALAMLRENAQTVLEEGESWKLSSCQSATVREYPTPSADFAAALKVERAHLEFCNALVAAGILRREPDKDETIQKDDWGGKWTGHVYHFTGIQQQDVFFDTMQGEATFLVTRFSFSKITGIQQEGNKAEVEVEVSATPTDMYKRVSGALAKNPPRGWPEIQELTRSKTRSYHFVRYDDGWRLR